MRLWSGRKYEKTQWRKQSPFQRWHKWIEWTIPSHVGKVMVLEPLVCRSRPTTGWSLDGLQMSLFHLNRWGRLVVINSGLTRLWFWSCSVGGKVKQHFSLSSFVFSMLRTAFSLAGWVSLIKATNAATLSGRGRHSESGGEIAPRIWDSEWMPKGCSGGSLWVQYLAEFLIFYFTNW